MKLVSFFFFFSRHETSKGVENSMKFSALTNIAGRNALGRPMLKDIPPLFNSGKPVRKTDGKKRLKGQSSNIDRLARSAAF